MSVNVEKTWTCRSINDMKFIAFKCCFVLTSGFEGFGNVLTQTCLCPRALNHVRLRSWCVWRLVFSLLVFRCLLFRCPPHPVYSARPLARLAAALMGWEATCRTETLVWLLISRSEVRISLQEPNKMWGDQSPPHQIHLLTSMTLAGSKSPTAKNYDKWWYHLKSPGYRVTWAILYCNIMT